MQRSPFLFLFAQSLVNTPIFNATPSLLPQGLRWCNLLSSRALFLSPFSLLFRNDFHEFSYYNIAFYWTLCNTKSTGRLQIAAVNRLLQSAYIIPGREIRGIPSELRENTTTRCSRTTVLNRCGVLFAEGVFVWGLFGENIKGYFSPQAILCLRPFVRDFSP